MVFLLGGAFRQLIADLHRELALSGYPEARPAHGFALQAIGPDGCSITELGRRLGVTKQAAAKSARSLEAAGYIVRQPQPSDGRAVLLIRTASADKLLRLSATIWGRRVQVWRREVGPERFDEMIETLRHFGEPGPIGDLPGWLGQ